MEVVRCSLSRHLRNEEEDDDKDFLLWEGNYWDEPVHDCAQLSLSTVNVLVNKIAFLLEKECKEGEKMLLFLPQVIQLPLSLMASAKAGVTAIPLDPKNCSEVRLRTIVEKSRPVLVITVDAYWQGDKLLQPYVELDKVLEETGPKVLVIRHTCPNPGVPPPEEHIPARRPYYKIEWSIREDRDVEWSEEIRRIPNDTVALGREISGSLFLLPDKENDVLRPIYEKELIREIESLTPKFDGVSFSLCHPESFKGLVTLFAIWWKGNSLVQFEGVSDYPDPSRIAHIVKKYEVQSLILSDEQLDPSYLRLVETKTLEIVVGPENARSVVEEGFLGAKFLSMEF